MNLGRKGLWIVAGLLAAAVNAVILSAVALALFPKFNFTTIAQLICREDETILYRTEPGSAYTDPEGNVSYPEEVYISCVGEDGSQRKNLEALAMITVLGIYWLAFFLFSMTGIGTFFAISSWKDARVKEENEKFRREMGYNRIDKDPR
jgi:hypothetical protein